MSLFDFFKPKGEIVTTLTPAPSKKQACDISKTNIVAELLKVSRHKRDDTWYQSFYQNVPAASFASATPQTLIGPDGFTYFVLNTPDINKTFEPYCIQNMKDDFLLNNGWGIVLNPAEDKSAEWVFTYGNIVNFHLNNEFVSVTEDAAVENIEFTKTVGVIKKAEQVLVAQPSESYLPKATRRALKAFLQRKGITRPKLMMLTTNSQGKSARKLAFNIHPENYPVTSKLDYLMQQVGWFLPNNYILVALPKKSSLVKDLQDM